MTERETNKIVSENLNYVKSVANQYRGNGVEFDDLVSEGTLAMIMAARKFDETRGSQFVAYASPFIRKAMQQAIDKQSALYRVPKDQKKYAPRNAAKAVSIDAPLSVGNQYTLLDILVNKDAKMADDNTAFTQMLNDLERCVEELDERDRTVISKFYGIGTKTRNPGRNCRRHAIEARACTPDKRQGDSPDIKKNNQQGFETFP